MAIALIWAVLAWEPIERPSTPMTPERAVAQEPVDTARLSQRTTPPSAREREAAPTDDRRDQAVVSTADPTPSDTAAGPVESPPPVRSGPVDDLERLFATEPRASTIHGVESLIEQGFRSSELPAELLKSVICRSTVCKIETHWRPDRSVGFASAFARLLMSPTNRQTPLFGREYAVAPSDDVDRDGSREVAIYIKLAHSSASLEARGR
jgi:hypothetical protein